MRNEAPVIVLADWAARTNAETRRVMGVSVAPEISERQEARAYLDGLMTDREAAACAAADLARVWALCGQPDEQDDYRWPRELWAQPRANITRAEVAGFRSFGRSRVNRSALRHRRCKPPSFSSSKKIRR